MRKTMTMSLSVLLLLSLLFSGCAKEPVETDPYADMPETPAEMFTYEENEDGGITITSYIGEDAEVKIPEKIEDISVTQIGPNAFAGIYSLTLVVIPNTVTRIERCAFILCQSLEKAELSNTLTSIGAGAFSDCSQLSDIRLPNTLTELGNGSFKNCTSLKQITIPASVRDWGFESFTMSGLETVVLEDGLELIGDTAFFGTAISQIDIPSSVKTIGRSAFAGCNNLATVTLHEGLESIDYAAFGGTNQLTEIVIPSSVQEMQDVAFDGCSTLEKLKFEGDAPENFKHVSDAYLESGEYFPFIAFDVHFTVYYHEGAQGFTSPEWEGYPTEIW